MDPLALEVERIRFTILLKRPVGFHFVHTGALSGLLRNALGNHELHPGIMPVGPGMGRVRINAGERYTFGVTLVGPARSLADDIIAGVARLGTVGDRQPLALYGNYELAKTERLSPLDWTEELAGWEAGDATITLRLVSPLRIPRPQKEATPTARYFNNDYFTLEGFLGRVVTRITGLTLGRQPAFNEREKLAPAIPPESSMSHGHLVWVDVPIGSTDRADAKRRGGYTKGGVLGRIELHRLPEDWLPWLAVACETGVGEGTRMGLGRVRRSADHPTQDWCQSERTLFDGMMRPAELRKAAAHFGDEAEALLDGIEDAEIEGAAATRPGFLGGASEPGALWGHVIPKGEDSVRALAVPPLRDRLLQRAAAAQLTPAAEALFDDCSFAYRKGLSYRSAARAVARARREGFEWVLDADITSFFDFVDWPRLQDKLEALFPFDPIVGMLMDWVRAPVWFDGRLIQRHSGLPQGAPISPVLANLYLDELDDALMGGNFRLVRYADDFVVLCKDREEALRARDEARMTLEKLGLSLHPEKTRVTTFADGFTYLGHLFLGSTVVERQGAGDEKQDFAPAKLGLDGLPAGSWVAQIPLRDVRRVAAAGQRSTPSPLDAAPEEARTVRGSEKQVRRKVSAREVPPDQDAGLSVGDRPSSISVMDPDQRDRDAQKRPIHIVDETARLRLEGGTLVIERPDLPRIDCPLAAISHVTIIGASRMTVPLLLRLGEHGVPVFFCRRSGALRTAVHYQPDWTLWRAQLDLVADAPARLAFSTAQVQTKLRNGARMLVSHGVEGSEVAARDLRRLAADAAGANSLDALRGLEGAGAAVLFNALRKTLPSEWGFEGRNRRPPRDPANALLSFGYGILYRQVTTALVAAGLNPRLGLFHRVEGQHHALASDVVEEYRYLIEGLLLAMISRRELTPASFSTDDTLGCRLLPAARRKVLDAVEHRLLTEFTTPQGTKLTYRMQMDVQARRLRAFILGTGPAYMPHEAR